MPMETSAVGIRPVGRPSAPSGVDGVGRRGGEAATSGFRPQTNVSIENAIQDMAGILSKISTAQSDTMEKMPADLQKVIENVMKQAFSFDETLGEGLGSTMESQRFSMEQLTSVARTLMQMSALAEKGYDVNISDGLQKLFANLKLAVTQEPGGQAFEPVLLLKAAFGLINGKETSDLPQALQQFLSSMQANVGQGAAQPQSESMAFLKAFVQYMMPRSEASAASASPQGQTAGTSGQNAQGAAMQNGAFVEGNAANGTGVPQNATTGTAQGASGTFGGQGTPGAQATLTGQAALPGQEGGMAQGQPVTAQGQAAMPQGAATAQGSAEGAAMTQGQTFEGSPQAQTQGTANAATGSNAANATNSSNPANASNAATAEGNANVPNSANPQAAQMENGTANAAGKNVPSQMQQAGTEAGRAGVPTGQQAVPQDARSSQPTPQDAMQNMTLSARDAKAALMSQPIQNTPEAMQTLKQLARFFLEQGNVSQADARALQSFAESDASVLSPKEARQLETLLRVVQQNIPATVQQAAIQQSIPELPRLWAFMQLADLSVVKRLNTRQLKKAAKDVAEFVFSMRGSMEGEHAVQQGQRSMNFMMPMYLGENEQSYPAYIHVYDETQEDPETGMPKKETWLRLCMLTENLGAVELTCRVYEQQHLDMRLVFSHHDVAQEFRSFVPELRKSMRGSRLKLEDVAISAPGE